MPENGLPRPNSAKFSRMKLAAFNSTCAALPHTAHVVQWGGAHVWKVGGAKGKMFAIAWDEGAKGVYITFKVSALSYDMMKEQEGLRPAPYLASRGMTWIQRTSPASLDDAGLKIYLKESHRLCALNLPKAVQKAMGLGG
jgi:predicted DNA-binding protein (MmcQ/YjbR family)